MTAEALHQSLLDAGLTVRADPGWDKRGSFWRRLPGLKPQGVMHHHTAPPVPFPIHRLNGSIDGRIKANINTKPDGTVWLVAYKACNYSSGPGSATVLAEVAAGTPPTANAKERRLKDDTNGNPRFFNFENDHPGDGTPIPQIQFDAIVAATEVVVDHYGLTPNNVISHAEWTARKRDPYWNGTYRAIEQIRGALMSTPKTWTAEDWAVLDEHVLSNSVGAFIGTGTNRRSIATAIARIEATTTGFDTDLDDAVTELIDVLPDEVLDRLYQRLAPGPR